MTKKLKILSIYEGFFTGGARILHTDLIIGLQDRGHENTVLSINSHTTRENTSQPMEKDRCYQNLISKEIPIHTLGRRATEIPDLAPSTVRRYCFLKSSRKNLTLSLC